MVNKNQYITDHQDKISTDANIKTTKYACTSTPSVPKYNYISKSWSTKMNVSGPNFEPNTSSFFDSFLLIFWDGGSTL
jgi:hypothetical protein